MQNREYNKDTKVVLDALISLIPSIRSRHDIGHSIVDREDALMDSITKLLEREKRLTQDKEIRDKKESSSISKRGAQLYAIKMVRNRLIDMIRKEKRQEEHRKKVEEEKNLSENAFDGGDLCLLLEADQLLNQLKNNDILLLKAYFAGDPYFTWQIKSQRLTRGTARVRIHRIIKKLRKISNANSNTKPKQLDSTKGLKKNRL